MNCSVYKKDKSDSFPRGDERETREPSPRLPDKNGNQVARYSYDAWGMLTDIYSDDSKIGYINPFRYRSYYYDSEISLYYLQSRYYDPRGGRFLNADMPEFGMVEQGALAHNLYNYCYNNPINLFDFTGYQPKWAQVVGKYAKGTLAYKVFLFATKKGWFSNLFWSAGFFRTPNGVYHTRQDCWQQFFGYNNFYDWAFNLGTDMQRTKFPFFLGNKEYIFWAWKGDYLNLGAGAELGIYSRLVIKGKNISHWISETKSSLFMSMTLKYRNKVIATYTPKSKQWWITCFNPYHQDAKAHQISVTFNIYFSSNKKLFKAFYNKYGTGRYKNRMWKFYYDKYIATLTFK